VTYWNDSKATNFHAVEAALAGFAAPVLLIAGGRAKGGDIPGFVGRIASRLKHAFIIGETRHTLADACATHHVPHTVCSSLEEAVQKAAANSVDGDHVLLSPGFASFDMFNSYEDRGDRFEQLVNNLRITSASR
jgi:UDP-N-acetylmuramoylalanine--D-glutamate ligase